MGGTEPVLLVDDEEMIVAVGREILTALGYRVMVAPSGKKAVALYEKNKDRGDMVILDLIMFDMGGGEVYDRLKEINPKVKCPFKWVQHRRPSK
ncbi:MAG: response regulator [Thermodesulfobacteriota bacterium]|nr:response regulator [Thermodesulfobacteriota bacterium]